MNTSSAYITISFFRGWVVATAASSIGLVLGILYIWSVVRAGFPASWGWSNADMALPYSIMCIVFAIVMVPAGHLQDRFGPRRLVFIGGFLAGLGCVISGLGGSSLIAYIIGFGIITGAGVGFGYSALTPAAVKWFPPNQTGLVTGVVVGGTGLAPVPLAPLTSWLLTLFEAPNAAGVVEKGVPMTMIVLGIIIWVVVGLVGWFIFNPPIGFIVSTERLNEFDDFQPPTYKNEFSWRYMIKTPRFWLLYIMYFCGASAGLVFISVALDLGKNALGEWAFLAVVVMALGNTVGRILSGAVSDKIGRSLTLFIEFNWQALMITLLFIISYRQSEGAFAILSVIFIIGLNYGSNLTIFPATCKEFFGLRYFGVNYGFLFTAFGAAGLIMPWVNGLLTDVTGNSHITYYLIIGMMLFSAVLSIITRLMGPPQGMVK